MMYTPKKHSITVKTVWQPSLLPGFHEKDDKIDQFNVWSAHKTINLFKDV